MIARLKYLALTLLLRTQGIQVVAVVHDHGAAPECPRCGMARTPGPCDWCALLAAGDGQDREAA